MTTLAEPVQPMVPASIVDLWNRFGWPDEDTLAALTEPVDHAMFGPGATEPAG